MAPRYSLARRKARDLLALGRIEAPPVPLEQLADLCNATIRFEPFDGDVSGMVHRGRNGTAIIGVNSLHSDNRKRFTIAHELGHLHLHSDEVHFDERAPLARRDGLSSKATDPKEIEANQFAAELLMPSGMLHGSLSALQDSEPDISVESAIEFLAGRYLVSQLAMTHRLTNLGIVTQTDDVAD